MQNPELMEIAFTIGTLVISLLVGFVARLANQYFGIQIEQVHQDNLKRALTSGIREALSDGVDDPLELRERAQKHARRSVPGAMKALKPAQGVLDTLSKAAVTAEMISKIIKR